MKLFEGASAGQNVCVVFAIYCMLLRPVAVAGDSAATPLAPLLKKVAEQSTLSTVSPDDVLEVNTRRLREHFDTWLKEPNTYRQRVLRECRVFPEGRIYPFAIPALAYANLALCDAEQRQHSASQMRKLLDLLIPTVVEDINPPGNDLNRLTNYQKEGTRLATLNLTLACYALLSGDGRYNRLHDHVSLLLQRALTEKPEEPLASYPSYTWYFDTMIALVSLDLHDRAHGLAQSRSLIEQHLAWIRLHGTDADTGLPIAYKGGLPRGCDLSMQICLLEQVDSPTAHRLYADYVKHHWVDFGFIAGFREWPKSKEDSSLGDVDSGPLILGIGPTATGVGIGAARAVNDTNHLNSLARQLDLLPGAIQVLETGGQEFFGGQVPISGRYVTGFLYGDAVLFYAITWVPYPKASKATPKSAPTAR